MNEQRFGELSVGGERAYCVHEEAVPNGRILCHSWGEFWLEGWGAVCFDHLPEEVKAAAALLRVVS